MTKKTIYLPFALIMLMGANLGLYSCKDKKKEETTTVAPAPEPVPAAPAPAPVEIQADDPLTKSVADATKDYPTVKTDVKDGTITLTGEVKRTDLKKLMMSLNELHPKKIDNQLVIK